MPPNVRPSPPPNDTVTRLLDAAARLFYEQGVGVGVAALCQEAGVSKRSMYQYFASKDEVLAASLARSVPGYLATLLPDVDSGLTPLERVVRVFKNVERIAADPTFRGCPYVSVANEVKSTEHPARGVAKRFHDSLTAYLREALQAAGASNPSAVAQQLTAVHDGVLAGSVVQGRPLTGLATSMTIALLAAEGLQAPAQPLT